MTVNRFYIRKYIFEDDHGWLFPNEQKYNLFGIEKIETYNSINDLGEGNEISLNSYIYAGNFYIDKKYSYHKRWFTKAFESLAVVNAFYKTLYIIFGFFSSIYNHFMLFQIIMEKFNDSSKPFNSHKVKIFRSDNEIYNVPNYNDINSKIDISNMNLRFNNSNNIIKNKNIGEIQPASISNKNVDYLSVIKQRKEEKDNNKEIPKININNKPLIYKEINQQKISDYNLFCFHIFHCCLLDKKKVLYRMNNMNRNLFLKKIDIERYLDLFKKVDYLTNAQYQKIKSTKDNLIYSLNIMSDHI